MHAHWKLAGTGCLAKGLLVSCMRCNTIFATAMGFSGQALWGSRTPSSAGLWRCNGQLRLVLRWRCCRAHLCIDSRRRPQQAWMHTDLSVEIFFKRCHADRCGNTLPLELSIETVQIIFCRLWWVHVAISTHTLSLFNDFHCLVILTTSCNLPIRPVKSIHHSHDK